MQHTVTVNKVHTEFIKNIFTATNEMIISDYENISPIVVYLKHLLVMSQKQMGLCKIDSWIWTIFSFVLHMMTWWSVLVMVPTVFNKTQARARKSIFRLKSYKNMVVNHLKLIRDKLKHFLELKIQVLNGVHFKNGIDSTCRLETTAFAKLVVKMCLVVP